MNIKSAKYFKISYEDAPDKTSIQAVIDDRNSIKIDITFSLSDLPDMLESVQIEI